MIKISEAIKKLYIEDSTPIELEVRFKDNTFPTIKGSGVLSEQMTLHESICEEEQLKFGGCNASSFELTVFNLNSGIKGYEIEPVLITSDTEIPLGVFYVETIEKYAGKDYKKLTAYDKMRYFDVDVKDWYDSITFPISVKNFRDGLCEYVGVEQNEATLITDSIMLTKELDSSNGINGLSLMKQICEISGVFGRMDRYGKFDYLSLESSMLLPADDLYPANDLYPSAGSGSSENSFNIPTSLMYEHPLVEDFFTSNIDGVIIVDSEGAQVVTEYNQNPYYLQDNFVIMGQTHETITALANALLSKISSISYRPINSSKIKGQPYVECGDFISGEVNGYCFEAYVFQRDLTGIKALRDSYICKGKEILENDMNGVTAQLQRLNKTTERVKTSVQVTEKGLESEVKRATDAERNLSTRIEQTEQQIVLRVDSATGKIVQVSLIGDTGSGTEFKVDADNINLSANDVINLLSGGTINLTGKNISITSDNFSVTKDGKMDCKEANVKGKITLPDALYMVGSRGTFPILQGDNGLESYKLVFRDLKNAKFMEVESSPQGDISESVAFKLETLFEKYARFRNGIRIGEDTDYASATYNKSKKRIEFSGDIDVGDATQITTNKTLWSGTTWPNEESTLTLNQKVTQQAKGIVLVFSTSSDLNDFQYFFVPKSHVIKHSGKSVYITLSDAMGNKMGKKIVYIYNDKIVGHSLNDNATYTSDSGIKFSPNDFILVEVLGI